MTVTEGNYFSDEGTRYPISAPQSVTVQWTGTVAPATQLAADGDILYLIPLPFRRGTITRISGQTAALDSGSDLDMDVVLRDDSGVTTIYDASAESNQIGRTALAFDKVISQTWDVASSTTLPAIGFKAVTDAATDASGTCTINVEYEQSLL